MEADGVVTATKNSHWLRVIPLDPTSSFSNAMIVNDGELSPGDHVTVTIAKNANETP